jgi:dTDP-4-amino-4,6-dideoxygalactose transaminase
MLPKGIPANFHLRTDDQKVEEHARWCYKKPFSAERFLHYLSPSISAGHVTNDGPLQGVLQAKIQGLVRTKLHVMLCSNGTAALHALVAGLALQQGKESLRWVTQAFTFPSAIQGPLQDALVVDNDSKLYGPSLNELQAKKGLFDGVIVTNVFGFQTKMGEYEKWCRENGKLLVFDNAATPIGTLEDGRCIHDIGNGTIISLHETKPLGRGEGGVVIVPKESVKFVHRAMNFGFDTTAAVRVPNRQSSNWRMSDIAAAAVCDHLDFIIAENWLQRFEHRNTLVLSKLAERNLSLVFPPPQHSTVFSCLFVQLPAGHMDCDQLCQQMWARGVEAKHYYLPLGDRVSCPMAWSIYDHSICLPFHLGISDVRALAILDVLLDCLRSGN